MTEKKIELDIVCEGTKSLLLGECKWRNEKVGIDVLEKVKSRFYLFPEYEEYYVALFSKTGFMEEVYDKTKGDPTVLLYDMTDLCKV